MLNDAAEDVLAFMAFPKAHRKQLASSNPLERINAEIKRRTDVVGILPNDAAIVRLVKRALVWDIPALTTTKGTCLVMESTASIRGSLSNSLREVTPLETSA